MRVIPSIKKRANLELHYDVLRAIDAGAFRLTNIMYRANTSYIQLKNEIMPDLLLEGLVEVETVGKRKCYFITEKGKWALKLYEQLPKFERA